jgi:hypothetical protein
MELITYLQLVPKIKNAWSLTATHTLRLNIMVLMRRDKFTYEDGCHCPDDGNSKNL